MKTGQISVFFASALLGAAGLFCSLAVALAAEPAPQPSPSPSPTEAAHYPQQKSLDGVYIEAVENFPTPKKNEISLGLGIYPFNAYYTGMSLTGAYTYAFNATHAWEILSVSYFFTFQKDLISQLAEKGVNPQQIDFLQLMASTNGVYTFANGKMVFLKDYLRFFRAAATYGLGLVNTTFSNSLTVNLGVRMEAFITDSFAWKLDVRDQVLASGFDNMVTFSISTAFSF